MQPEWDAQVRDRVVRLVGALRALAPPARPPVAHVDAHEAVLWLEELGCPVGTGPEVLRLRRPAPVPAPAAPPEVAGWVDPPGDDLEPPALHERGPLHGQHAYLVDAPGVRDAHDAWTAAWRPWAHRERARRRQVRLADRLAELARLAAAPGRELVLAAGLLHLPDGGTHVHVLGQPVAVRTEPGTGDLVCTVTGPPSWEDDRTPAPSDPAAYPLVTDAVEILARWGGPACAVDPGWARPSGPDPVLATAPALVVRRTGAVALHRCWDAIDRHVRDAAHPLPLGLVQLVREVPLAERAAWLARSGAGPVLDDPLLPPTATEDQARAVAAVGDDTGVVIEGPPGTGKTQTVAALLGALLADGRRVLVTGGDAGSLRVLRDRLPAGLRDLCVGLDGGDAVARLAGERTEFDPVHADRAIADLTARRADAVRTRDDLRARIGLLREAEARVYPEISPGFGGTPAQVARTLVATQARDGWVTGDAEGDPPVDDAEFADLLDLLREQTPRHRARRDRLPLPAPLSPEGFARLVAAIGRGPHVRPGPDDALVTALGELPPASLTVLEELAGEVGEAAAALRALSGPSGWARSNADALLASGPSRSWLDALAELDAVDAAVEHARRVGAPVEVGPGVDEPAATRVLARLADHLDRGAALNRVFRGPEQRAAERLGTSVLVEGAPPRTADAARTAVHHLAVRAIAHRVDAAFAPLRTGIPDGPHAVEDLLDLRHACGVVQRLHAAVGAVGRVLVELAPQARPPLGSVDELERVARLATLARAARAARLAHAEIAAAVSVVEAVPPERRMPEHGPLLDALRGLDPTAHTAAGHALETARREHRAQLRADDLLGRVRAASPALADALAAGSAPDPGRWGAAWARAVAATWTARQPGADEGPRLDAELAVATATVASLSADLTVARARRACLGRIDTAQAQALAAYRHAVAQARAGSGDTAEALRRSAREAMAVALCAVPAWVLPVPELLETLAHRPGSFDVVIVDEATRLDPSCAFLLWLAPRVVVVGDDGQCPAPAPPAPVLDAALPDVPGYLRAALGPGSSLFALLRTRFGPVVALRDQFRGLPGIAAWAPGRDDPPAPLRRPVAGGLPELRATHVPGGPAAEVRVLVATVAACAGDPAYAGRGLGVVVPGGRARVAEITASLTARLAPAAWARLRLRVGTPQDFRGDERDVVLLDAGAPAPVQDYVLAASRARDQLWVLHPALPAELPPGDPRRLLLDHVLAHAGDPAPVPSGVRADRRDDRFDSLFEQAVFLDLAGRGFHVLPQVTVHGRRVDLVVTGAGGTVAVECDGEAFRTTPDQRAADLAREQELAGCGWTFVRVRESVHLLDRDAALAPVLAALAERGIAPLGRLVDGEWTAHQPPTEALTTVTPTPHPRESPSSRPRVADLRPAGRAGSVDGTRLVAVADAGTTVPGIGAVGSVGSAGGPGVGAAVDTAFGAAADTAVGPVVDTAVVGTAAGPAVHAPVGPAVGAVAGLAVHTAVGPAVDTVVGAGATGAEAAGAAAPDAGERGVDAGVAVPTAPEPGSGHAASVDGGCVPGPQPGEPATTAVGIVPAPSGEASATVRMPGPRVPVDGPGREPAATGRHALREVPDGPAAATVEPTPGQAVPQSDPVPLFEQGAYPALHLVDPPTLFGDPDADRPTPAPVDARPDDRDPVADLFTEAPRRPDGAGADLFTEAPDAPRPVDPARRAALLDVARDRPLTPVAVRNLLGVDPDTALDLLGALAGEGVLARRGAGRTAHWVRSESPPRDALMAEFPRRRGARRRRPRLPSTG